MKKRRIKKAYKKFFIFKKLSPLEYKAIGNNEKNTPIIYIFMRYAELFKYNGNKISPNIGGIIPNINPLREDSNLLWIPEIERPVINYEKFVKEATEQICITFQVPLHILRGEYKNKEEGKMNIFKKSYGSSNCVEDRLCDVKSSNDLEDLKEALNTEGLQKTVEKAILSKIKKLEKDI